MEKTAVKMQRYLIISSMLALTVLAAGCGSSDTRPVTGGAPAAGTTGGGGTTAAGGTTVTGGTTETGGATVTGGTTETGGATTLAGGTTTAGGTTAAAGSTGSLNGAVCPPGVAPTAAEITNFTSAEWNGITDKFGTGAVIGGIFGYGGTSPSSTIAASVDSAGHTLVLAGSVLAKDYAGGGLSFDECVNASAYSGVQFTLGGSTGGCDLIFNVQTFDEKPAGTNQVGGCTSGCYSFPNVKLTSTSGPVTVPFSTLSGGQLIVATALQNEMVGLQWQFQPSGATGCDGINLTITNVSFVQ